MDSNNKKELATAVIEAVSACAELKAAAEKYLAAIGTSSEADAAAVLVAEAKEDINLIDDTIAFFGCDKAKQIFGEELAAEKYAQALEAKASGAKYCNCPGCSAAEAIINAENELL